MKHPLAFGAVLYVALMTISAARAQTELNIDSGNTVKQQFFCKS